MVKFEAIDSLWAARDTIEVARSLLGKVLVRKLSDDHRLIARIVETEAYLGPNDPACHTFQGRRTPRTEPMFSPPGTCYVYLIYGMYHCLNLVTGEGEAVLIRALQPLSGFPLSEENSKILSGPGKLCRRMSIDKRFNNKNLLSIEENLFIATAHKTFPENSKTPFEIADGPRIGIDSTGDAALWPLRFGIKNSPYLSRALED